MSDTNQKVVQFYDFLRSVKENPDLLAKYEGNHAKLFEDGGLDIDNLPPEILDKISAAGLNLNAIFSGIGKGVEAVSSIISMFV